MKKDAKNQKKSEEPTPEKAATPPPPEPAPQKDDQSSESNNKESQVKPKKIKRCGGNACSKCGKCTDWHYTGDIAYDYDRYQHKESYDICNPQRWLRSPNATCLVYTNGLIYSSGDFSILACQCN
ncbi:hypothetical protein I4U23_016706 [Adineta vaga]|nr:hypothetical protein I4U23_016706 [Adineta vaga]